MASVRLAFLAALLIQLPSLTASLSISSRAQELPVPQFEQGFQQPEQVTPQGALQWPLQEDPTSPYGQSSELLQAETQMRQQQLQFLGCAGQHPGFFRRSVGLPIAIPQSSNQNPMILYGASNQKAVALDRTLIALQQQLAVERSNEVQLANLAAARQQDMLRANASFARILTLVERGADQEKQLQEQLTNAKAMNDALHVELTKVQSDKAQKAKELFDEKAEVAKLQEKVQMAEGRAKDSEAAQNRALRVMKDVQAAQAKVQRTEDIIRTLLPRIEPHLHPSKVSPALEQPHF